MTAYVVERDQDGDPLVNQHYATPAEAAVRVVGATPDPSVEPRGGEVASIEYGLVDHDGNEVMIEEWHSADV